MRARYRVLLLLALLLEAGFVALRRLGNFQEQVVEFIAVYLAGSLFYLLSCWLIIRWSSAGRLPRSLWTAIWVAGIAFRLTVFPLDPQLSEDLYRYRWQGKLQAAGGNPYTEAPGEAEWADLRDETWPRVNRKDLPSVYGPVLEQLYFRYYRLVSAFVEDAGRQAWWFKLPFALAEIGVGLALWRLLAAAGRPREWLLIYWWSPLAVVEFWAQGHNDPLAVLFVVLALTAALRERWTPAYVWLTLAALCKFWPAILFPLFLLRREAGRWVFRWKPALAAGPVTLLAVWPYLGGVSEVTEVLEGFLGGWRNNDSLFGLIYQYVDRDYDRATEWVRRLVILSAAAIWALQRPLVQTAQWTVAALLFLSANCFPWYLSWLLPLLAVHPNAALLLWTALVVLAYHVLIGYSALGVWEYQAFYRKLEYWPVFGLLIGSAAVRAALLLWPAARRRWFVSRDR